MNVEDFRDYCLHKSGTTEETPFDEYTLVFKVMGKIYALTPLDEIDPTANLKCDPEWSSELRDEYPDIIPGYHMNKKHWNTIYLARDLDDIFIKKLIDHSYDMVVRGLSRKLKEELDLLK